MHLNFQSDGSRTINVRIVREPIFKVKIEIILSRDYTKDLPGPDGSVDYIFLIVNQEKRKTKEIN